MVNIAEPLVVLLGGFDEHNISWKSHPFLGPSDLDDCEANKSILLVLPFVVYNAFACFQF